MHHHQYPRITTTFIDLLTDYGFKRIFGTEEHKEILRRFLNALFENEMYITEVSFHDKEVLPRNEEGKRVIFDIYCTTDTGHHFIVEMQQEYGVTFEKRIIHYTATGIVDQTRRGGNYDFRPVFTIVFANFRLKQLPPKQVSEVLLMEKESKNILSEDLKIYFLSLPEVKKEWKECESELDRMLYIIKNMDKMDKNSEAYRSKKYPEIFDASEVAAMGREDVVAYSQSLEKKNEIREYIDYASEQSYKRGVNFGIEKGMEKGMEKGKEEGREEERINSVKILDSVGIPHERIAAIYNLSLCDVKKILG